MSLPGIAAMGWGWHVENYAMQAAGYLILFLSTKAMKNRYGGWRAIFHLDLYLLLSAFIFLFA